MPDGLHGAAGEGVTASVVGGAESSLLLLWCPQRISTWWLDSLKRRLDV